MDWKEELGHLERTGQWKDAVALVRRITDEHADEPEAYIRTMYLLLNLLLEEDYASHGLDHDTLAQTLRQYFEGSCEKFKNSAEYLFFVGYFMGLAEWYFGQDNLDMSHQMLQKATQLQPENLLYEWAYRFVMGHESAAVLCERLISGSEEIKWLESKGSPGKYIIDVIRNCQLSKPFDS
jgi:hypothetical protein